MGGVPVDLLGEMLDVISNPPPGFTSKFKFEKTDLRPRIDAIKWFGHCGEPTKVDLTMDIRQVRDWAEATTCCTSQAWTDVQREANNQLTIFLGAHDSENYLNWNEKVIGFRQEVLAPLSANQLLPYQKEKHLQDAVVLCADWDIMCALMENAYIDSGHSSFFFLELFRVYEAGHFPCGWEGQWPEGRLLVY